MTDYWMETLAVLILGWCVGIVDCMIAYGIWKGIWLLLIVVPPDIVFHLAIVYMWKSRPSVRG